MSKNIIKEIIIILLLALAIIMVLGVLLYEYVPANKIIPEKISYTTPENVRTELETSQNNINDEIIVTYEIDATDLNNYKKIQEYVPGKKNPFKTIENEENGNKTNENNGQVVNPTNSGYNATNSNVNINSTNDKTTGYIPEKGTK